MPRDGDFMAEIAEARRKERQRLLLSAEVYIASERSDPFTRDRVLSHIENGVASWRRPANQEYGIEAGHAFYNASRGIAYRDVRTTKGIEKVPTTVYTNVTRP